MSKYELSISADYVSSWGVVEGAREFFQNALDEQTEDPENTMFHEYDPSEQILRIGNKSSTLDIQTLLFGNSSKSNNPGMIGKFGEGYKIATIVFLRNGKEVTFYNYCSKEVWHTKLVKSRRYKGALVPTFYVDKVAFWEKVPENSLIIEIKGVTGEEYESIKESNLWLQGIYDEGSQVDYYNTSYGKILLDDEYQGKLFVSGLYVCSNEKLEYGYDVNPDQIRLDRDRGLVSDIDLAFLTSKMWTSYRESEQDSRKQQFKDDFLAIVDTFDGSYTNYYTSSDDKKAVVTEFFEKNGTSAVPVISQDEAERAAKLSLKPIYVTENKKKIITASEEFQTNGNALVTKTLWQRLVDFSEAVDDRLTDEERTEIADIIEKSRWMLS